jgi:hypothetical protein
VAVIFAHCQFSVIAFCVVATIKSEFASITSSQVLIVAKEKYTKPEVGKYNCYFCHC